MSHRLANLVNTRIQPGTEAHPSTSRFDAFPSKRKLLKPSNSSSLGRIGLKSGNKSALRKTFTLISLLLVLCLRTGALGGQTQDAEYETVAEDT